MSKFDNFKAIVGGFRLMGNSSGKLISRKLMIHPEVSDDDLSKFLSASIKTPIGDDTKENSIVLMNDNCICFHQNGEFYLLPAKVMSMAVTSDSNTVHVLCDYGNKPILKSDFIEL